MTVSLKFCFEFRVKQKILYVPRPDPSSWISVNHPLDTPTPTAIPWTPQSLPTIVVKGVMFGLVSVEVECKVSNTIK